MWQIAVIGILLAFNLAKAHGSPLRLTVLPERSQVTYISSTQLGEFRGKATMHGTAIVDLDNLTAIGGSVSVDLRTLDSDNGARDWQMKNELLEIERFPVARFAGSEFESSPTTSGASKHGLLSGKLELHGVARLITVPVRFTLNQSTLRGEGHFVINLTDFGMTPPRLLGLKVRDKITVEILLVAAVQ